MPEYARSARAAGRLVTPDQWMLDGGMPRLLPMQPVALGDGADTVIYLSERTEPVMKTTARGRTWGYLGAVLHWTYFTPFRMQRGAVALLDHLHRPDRLRPVCVRPGRRDLATLHSKMYRLKRVPAPSHTRAGRDGTITAACYSDCSRLPGLSAARWR
jgi:hypothetical protein